MSIYVVGGDWLAQSERLRAAGWRIYLRVDAGVVILEGRRYATPQT